jgi:hypothetical protein
MLHNSNRPAVGAGTMVVCLKDTGVGPTGYWPVDCLEVQLAEEDPGSTAEIPAARDPDQGMVHETNCCLSILKIINHVMSVSSSSELLYSQWQVKGQVEASN